MPEHHPETESLKVTVVDGGEQLEVTLHDCTGVNPAVQAELEKLHDLHEDDDFDFVPGFETALS